MSESFRCTGNRVYTTLPHLPKRARKSIVSTQSSSVLSQNFVFNHYFEAFFAVLRYFLNFEKNTLTPIPLDACRFSTACLCAKQQNQYARLGAQNRREIQQHCLFIMQNQALSESSHKIFSMLWHDACAQKNAAADRFQTAANIFNPPMFVLQPARKHLRTRLNHHLMHQCRINISSHFENF
ncbi:hypothetical protein KS4_03970 [Poriferisphaera corsica]|uniref:Uncharacterized protein n=1 Tax=Poriferisphaera corsica TaxID=2528020 RepID=A0A517YQ65_9BACT|nr:hypothetical protein KS4_03970 [Poriferisphaera corsica]